MGGSLSEGVVIALITTAGVVLAAIIALIARVNVVITRVKRDVDATRENVVNDHPTNMRVEQDERHDENAHKLDTLLEEIGYVRGSVRKIWERIDRHTNQIHDLERTGPRPAFAPPPIAGRHRKELP